MKRLTSEANNMVHGNELQATQRARALPISACAGVCLTVALAIGSTTGPAPASNDVAQHALSDERVGIAGEVVDDDARDVVEFRVNQFTSNAQETPSVAIDPTSGRQLVVWGSRRQENGGFGIFGRLIDVDGQPVGDEIHINRWMTNNQERPSVAFDGSGVAWVVWQSYLQDGAGAGIVMRRFAMRDGVFRALGDEIIVNQKTRGDQILPTVAAHRTDDDEHGGGAMVAWVDRDEAGRSKVYGRLFSAAGVPRGDAFQVSGEVPGHATLPRLAPGADGSYVIAWASRNDAGVPQGILVRRVDGNGTGDGGEVDHVSRGTIRPVVADLERYHIEPAIASDGSTGQVVVAWLRQSASGRGYDVMVRRLDASVAPLGPPVVVAKSRVNGWKSGVDVAMGADGSFVVAYNDEADGPVQINEMKPFTPANIFAQRYDSSGSPAGGVFRLNREASGRQILPIAVNARRVAMMDDGSLVTAWQGRADGDGSGVVVTHRALGAGRPRVANSLDPVMIDGAILASKTLAPGTVVDRFPPEWDPFFVPEPPDPIVPNPGQDFGFQGFQNTGWTPPDPDIAVGPEHMVVVVNGGISFYTKSGDLTFADDISGPDGFWGEVGATNFVFDPVAVFDVDSNRFIVATTEHADNGDDVINIAVSDDADPNGDWNKYRFNMSSIGDFIDFPNLGVGPEAIVITADYFSGNTGNRIHIFDKQAAMNGDPITPAVITTSGGFRSLGAVNHLTPDAPAQYFATSFDGNNAQIGLDAIVDPNGSATRSNFLLSVPAFSQPPGADQQGTSNRAATVDMRIKNGVYRDGDLYLAHTIGDGGTARVRWYRIRMNNWPASTQVPQLVDWGTQDLGPGIHNWFPDISVDPNGIVGIAFNRSSSQEFISVQRTFRLPSDPPGFLREPQLQQVSTSPEEGSRWGDYGGVEQDPFAPGVFWNHHEYRTTSWRTWVGKFDVLANLPPLGFTYPDGRPAIVDSEGGTTFRVNVLEQNGQAASGTGMLHILTSKGVMDVPMIDLGNNQYEAVFPPTVCGSVVEYYVSARTTSNISVTDPLGAPNEVFAAESFSNVEVIFADDFETDQGWTVENIDLTDGAWARGLPQGGGTRGDPPSDFDGSGRAYLTNPAGGNTDVDGGPTRLISPVFDLSGSPNATIRYARWFFNDDGDGDRLTVEISNDGGASWVLVESVADANTGGWNEIAISPSDFLLLTNQMRMRFSAIDNPNDSVTEAAVDAFEIVVFECSQTTLVDADVAFGTLLDGDIDALRASDDVYLRARSQFGFSAQEPNIIDLIVGAETAATSPSTLDLSFEAFINNPGGTAKLRVRNWSTKAFEEVATFSIDQNERIFEQNGVTAQDRVRAGDGRVEVSTRLSVIATFSASGFEASFDQVGVQVN